ncbi:outer membrane beta-barrel protein [Bacteroides sp. 519]|uniref:outer membrane beta-barrel protein n=1 Tax=Bacteroides sp. 519 TaxID=2302937 RepID=UPI0013D15ECE|nr:outer membrane beta-barrel protein [Bacteroides sp. 519]NDV59386.1 hypothetical protein [Bacteroides sp. 519]
MKQFIALLLILAPLAGMAQEVNPKDTTLYVGNRKFVVKENDGKIRVKVFEEIASGDTIKNDQIFEGVYRDGQSTEQRISVSLPFTRKAKKRYKGHFDPHSAGIYLGYQQLGDGFMGFGSNDDVDLVASKSWEWGINLFDGALRMSKHFGVTAGLGFGYTSFRVDGNQAFVENENGITYIADAPEDAIYKKSRLRYYHLRLPVSLEFQQKFGWRGPLFVSVGAELETRFWTKSLAKVDGKKRTLDKDLNVRPLGVNLLVQAGYSNWGFYCRYSMNSLFEKNKGPEMYPYSLGIQWYW